MDERDIMRTHTSLNFLITFISKIIQEHKHIQSSREMYGIKWSIILIYVRMFRHIDISCSYASLEIIQYRIDIEANGELDNIPSYLQQRYTSRKKSAYETFSVWVRVTEINWSKRRKRCSLRTVAELWIKDDMKIISILLKLWMTLGIRGLWHSQFWLTTNSQRGERMILRVSFCIEKISKRECQTCHTHTEKSSLCAYVRSPWTKRSDWSTLASSLSRFH